MQYQGSLLVRYAPPVVADAYRPARLAAAGASPSPPLPAVG
ncbi:hypothetical protein OH828_00985 [Streptomyces anulatus]|nr:hypothetical protein OH791_00565 [Streptomyces anulatus]